MLFLKKSLVFVEKLKSFFVRSIYPSGTGGFHQIPKILLKNLKRLLSRIRALNGCIIDCLLYDLL